MNELDKSNEWLGSLNSIRHNIEEHSNDMNREFSGRTQEVKDMIELQQIKMMV